MLKSFSFQIKSNIIKYSSEKQYNIGIHSFLKLNLKFWNFPQNAQLNNSVELALIRIITSKYHWFLIIKLRENSEINLFFIYFFHMHYLLTWNEFLPRVFY